MVDKVTCKRCGQEISWAAPFSAPQDIECDRCWELRTRIQSDPEIARKILQEVDEQ